MRTMTSSNEPTTAPREATQDSGASPSSVDRVEAPEIAPIVEDVPPSKSAPVIFGTPPPTHRDKLRGWLAIGMASLLGVIVVVALYAWAFQKADLERMQSLALVFSPIVTLMGTILGFYFASDHE